MMKEDNNNEQKQRHPVGEKSTFHGQCRSPVTENQITNVTTCIDSKATCVERVTKSIRFYWNGMQPEEKSQQFY